MRTCDDETSLTDVKHSVMSKSAGTSVALRPVTCSALVQIDACACVDTPSSLLDTHIRIVFFLLLFLHSGATERSGGIMESRQDFHVPSPVIYNNIQSIKALLVLNPES